MNERINEQLNEWMYERTNERRTKKSQPITLMMKQEWEMNFEIIQVCIRMNHVCSMIPFYESNLHDSAFQALPLKINK